MPPVDILTVRGLADDPSLVDGGTVLISVNGVQHAVGEHSAPSGAFHAMSSLNRTYPGRFALNSEGELEGYIPIPASMGLKDAHLAIKGNTVYFPQGLGKDKAKELTGNLYSPAMHNEIKSRLLSTQPKAPSGMLAPQTPGYVIPPPGDFDDDDDDDDLDDMTADMGRMSTGLGKMKTGDYDDEEEEDDVPKKGRLPGLKPPKILAPMSMPWQRGEDE